MNPVDATAMRRTLEQSASKGMATSIAGLRILQPIFDKIPEDLVVCSGCGWGAVPGVQLCPRCHIAFSTIHSKVQRMVEGSMCSVMADATVCCIELGEGTVDSGQEEFVEEIERQPQDMEGHVPSRCLPIGGARPEALGITYFASADCSEHLQANEPPSLNPKRTSTTGSFGFLGKGRGKQKALTDESPEQKEERERAAEIATALREVRKSVGKFFVGPANKFYREVIEKGGEEAEILSDHVERCALSLI